MDGLKKRAIAVAIIMIWLGAGLVLAEAVTFESTDSQTTLVELFTSEGCSSCPPADVRIGKFKNDPDLWKRVVPVAFHVDYWNNLGWRDRFSKPEFAERQRRYAAAWRGESVYTPNFVANGREWRDWFNDRAVPGRFEKVGILRVTISSDNKVSATFDSNVSHPDPLILEVALLGANLESDVKRGENSGRKLHHDFVALALGRIDMSRDSKRWSGSGSLPIQSSGDKASALAAWITSGDGTGPIQATGGWLARPK